MVLLTQAVPLVEGDDLFIVKFQTGPPTFQLNIRNEQGLSFLVDSPLYNPHHPTKGKGLLGTGFIGNRLFLLHAEEHHPLTGTRMRDDAGFKSQTQPVCAILLSGVPLDNVVGLCIPCKLDTVIE